jgi:poly-gamma-glutamate capsule biosynthesis protein CapA/YwtB (metallophosphatase superfamily)
MSHPMAESTTRSPETLRIFLCGDVMTGRGIDQVLPHPGDPRLHESYMRSALGYVELAERAHGPIPKPVELSTIWGAALEDLQRVSPHARIVNLETSITRSDAYAPKGINYRMTPENAGCLVAAGIDCCVLANNHVLDWGEDGLIETLAVLDSLGIRTAGAGRTLAEAGAPAILTVAGSGRVLVVSCASVSSGTPRDWAAALDRAGVNLLPDLTDSGVEQVVDQVRRARRPGDIVIASIHWGPNWGYDVTAEQRRFAHRLIDRAGVSIVHGHSSHHPAAIEVYRDRLILYGCGDLLNDYEGIAGYEAYRDDLALMYFAAVDAARADLVALEMVPLQIRHFRLIRPSDDDVAWLCTRLNRASAAFGTRIGVGAGGRLVLSWR